MKIKEAYSVALLKEEGRFNCRNAIRHLENISHAPLSRWLAKPETAMVWDWSELPEEGYWVIDDCVIAKRHSKKN